MANIFFRLLSPYTVGELMKIDSGRQNRAAGCSIELINTYHELKKESIMDKFKKIFSKNIVNMYYVIFKLKVTSDTGKVHTVLIKLSPDFKTNNWVNNKIQVYCDCADFKYRSAYELNKHGSLLLNDKIRVLLSESITTSPKASTKTTILCKHSYAALNWIIDNYESLMKMI